MNKETDEDSSCNSEARTQMKILRGKKEVRITVHPRRAIVIEELLTMKELKKQEQKDIFTKQMIILQKT